MPFTQVFGGDLIFPSQLSYLSITTAVSLTLNWPTEQQIGGTNVVADFMDIDATVVSLNVDMPDAGQTSEGQKATFNNIGANLFTVRDNAGGTIQAVAPGEQWIIVLTDNTTAAGTWLTFQMGASVSVASAGALAGLGIKAISTTLNQRIDSDVEASTPFTVVDSDRAQCLIYTAGAGTANLPSPAAVGNDWFFMLRNSGTGTLNVLPPSGTIDGGASINLDPNDSAFIFTDGTNFFTVGLTLSSVIAFDFVSIAIPGSGDFILSGVNLNRIAYRFTGLLTGARKIVVPNTTQQYWVDNATTGAFALTIGTSAQVGEPAITQGLSEIFYCDAVDVVSAVSGTTIAFPLTIAQGGTGSTTAATARTALGVPPVTRQILAGVAMSGGGDLSADLTLDFAGALDDLSDVTIAAPATGSVLFKSAGDWLNTPAITIDPLDSVDLQFNGAVTFRTRAQGIDVVGDGADTASIQMEDNAAAIVGLIDITAATMLIECQVDGADIRIQGRDAGGGVSGFLLLNPDGDLQIFHPSEGAVGTVVARTLLSSAGGLEANNTLTGAGFERVLTTGDLVAIATFDTAEQAITAFTTIDTAHGLGGIPDLVFAVYICKIADNGYSVGDEVLVDSTGDGGGTQILTVGADATNVFGKIANVAASDQPSMMALATDTVFSPADGNWKWFVRAVRFS